MRATDDPTQDAMPWWARLLGAERRALAGRADGEEREAWVRCAGPIANLPPHLLDLQLGDDELSGDLRAAKDRWPIRDDSLDRIVLQHALEVSSDLEGLLDEALRVLKPEREIVLLTVGALSWVRCRLRFADCGAPADLRVHTTGLIQSALAARGCVDLRVSEIDFDGSDSVRVAGAVRMWSGLCLIEARKRHELPNVRRLRPRSRLAERPPGWVVRPSSRLGVAA